MRVLEWVLFLSLAVQLVSPLFLRTALRRLLLAALVAGLAACAVLVHGPRLAMLPACVLAGVGLVRAALFRSGRRGRPLLRAMGAGALALLWIVAVALPALFPLVDLPKPSGAYPVGTARLDFVEEDREDVVGGGVSDETVALRLWYPAASTDGCVRAKWMESAEAAYFAARMGLPNVLGQLCLVRTNSFWNAPLSEAQENYPVLLFSGGLGGFSGQNAVQAEELASRGYIVCAVSHPGEDVFVTHADGTTVGSDGAFEAALEAEAMGAYSSANALLEEESAQARRAFLRAFVLSNEAARVWSKDLIAAADYLEALNAAAQWAGRLDMDRLGVFGHSFGGAAAGEACLLDARFKAFVNLDGTPYGDTVDEIIDRPFLVMTAGAADETALQVSGYAQGQTGFWVAGIEGAQHMNFMDLNAVLPRAGRLAGLLGSVDAKRQTEIVNRYLSAFFDSVLGEPRAPFRETAVFPVSLLSF